MATAQQLEFQNRLREVMRKHRSMANGYTTRMRPDGLIVVKPRRRQSRISVRQVVIFLAAFILFKSFLIASLGEKAYAERVAKLRKGSVVEQAGAFAMEADALSILVAQELRPLLHPQYRVTAPRAGTPETRTAAKSVSLFTAAWSWLSDRMVSA